MFLRCRLTSQLGCSGQPKDHQMSSRRHPFPVIGAAPFDAPTWSGNGASFAEHPFSWLNDNQWALDAEAWTEARALVRVGIYPYVREKSSEKHSMLKLLNQVEPAGSAWLYPDTEPQHRCIPAKRRLQAPSPHIDFSVGPQPSSERDHRRRSHRGQQSCR